MRVRMMHISQRTLPYWLMLVAGGALLLVLRRRKRQAQS